MRKIRLSESDFELFEEELSSDEFAFFSKHKETFCCMIKDQGRTFWTRFIVVFRSYTVRHGIVRDMPCESLKIRAMLDHAFTVIQDNIVDAKLNASRAFINKIAVLALNKDKFHYLDSRSFTKDPFYNKETRDVFRLLFGPPDHKVSYIQVYVLTPVYLRFGGSLCRCLMKWINAEEQDPSDDTYWTPPAPDKKHSEKMNILCMNCIEECGNLYIQEKISGSKQGPQFFKLWTLGDPRFNDSSNPLYNPNADKDSDWRHDCEMEDFQEFVRYVKKKYGSEADQCSECAHLQNENQATKNKKKKKKKKKKISDVVTEVDSVEFGCSEKPSVAVTPDVVYAENQAGRKETSYWPFSKNATRRESVIYNKKSGHTDSTESYKVVHIEDKETRCSETTIIFADYQSKSKIDYKELEFMTPAILKHLIPEMPNKLELWQGSESVIAVLNYESEEKFTVTTPTNFNLKVIASNKSTIISIMYQLLQYVGKRKKRLCPGWIMEVEDVLMCVMLKENPQQDNLRICIQKGFHPKEYLDNEREIFRVQDTPENDDVKITSVGDWYAEKERKKKSTMNDLVKAVADISDGIEYRLEDTVIMKNGTVVHLKPGKPPVIDIRACSDNDKQRLNVNDLKSFVRKKEIELPVWDLISANPGNHEIFVLQDAKDEKTKEKINTQVNKCLAKNGYAVVECTNKTLYEVQNDESTENCLMLDTDVNKQLQKNCELQERSEKVSQELIRTLIANKLRLDNRKDRSDLKILNIETKPQKTVVVQKINISIHENGKRRSPSHHVITLEVETLLADQYLIRVTLPGYAEVKQESHKEELSSKIRSSLFDQMRRIMPFLEINKICVDVDEDECGRLNINLDLSQSALQQTFHDKSFSRQKTVQMFLKKESVVELTESEIQKMCRLKMATSNNQVKYTGTRAEISAAIKKQKANDLLACSNSGKMDEKPEPTEMSPALNKQKVKNRHTCSKGSHMEDKPKPTEISNEINEQKGKNKHTCCNSTKMEDKTKSAGTKTDVSPAINEQKERNLLACSNSSKMDEKPEPEPTGTCTALNEQKGKNLHVCSNCSTTEDRPKLFKKCQRCKQEGIRSPRFYCGKDCQVSDWNSRHRQEHLDGSLPKNGDQC